jgi:EmrB/QacA subfamily drug resistance transporter
MTRKKTGMPTSTITKSEHGTPADAMAAPSVDTRSRRARLLAHPTVALVAILTVQLMVVLDATIVNIALPDIRTALHFNTADLSWVINAYTLVFGGLLLLGARAGDLLGRRVTLIAGVGLFTAASLAGGFADSETTLLAARAVQGIGGALASPSALALLMTAFPGAKERLRALGLYTAVSIGGAAVGLISGGVLTQWASWRWVFFVNVPIGILLVALIRAVLPETPRQHGKLDVAGALTSTIGMTGLVYGFVNAASHGWMNTATIVSFVGGLVLLAAFVAVELRASSPIIPLHLFADRNRASSYLARLLLVAGMMGMFFFLTQFLQNILGYDAIETGLAFLPLTIMVFAASQLSARFLVEKIGSKRLMVGGISMSTVGLLILTQLSAHSSYVQLLATLVLFGAGNGLAFVPLTAAALHGVDAADAGAASGLVNVMQQVGGALGLAVLVTVFGTASKHAGTVRGTAAEQAQHAFVYGADRAFAVAALFLVLTVVLIAVVVRTRPATQGAPVHVGE